MKTDRALEHLGTQTAEAVQGIMRMFAPTGVVGGGIEVYMPGQSPFDDLPMPAIAAEVRYIDGVNGGNIFAIGIQGARRLAAAMMGGDPLAVATEDELNDLELSAVGEATNQMMAAAAAATSDVLSENVEIAPPELRRLASKGEVDSSWEHSGHSVAVSFTFHGSPCVLVQMIPNAFIVRMTRALDERTENHQDDQPLSEMLRYVGVRLWAELGRTKMPSGRAAGLPTGTIVELDRLVDDGVDIYVDGMRFATGRLLVADDGALAIRIEQLVGLSPADPAPPMMEATA